MGKSCCIEGCDVSSPDVEYFKFPRSGSLLAAWVRATGAPGGDVCSAHFTDEDYKSMRGKRRLLGTAVPSVFAKPSTDNGDVATDPAIDTSKDDRTSPKTRKAKVKKSTEKAMADSTTDSVATDGDKIVAIDKIDESETDSTEKIGNGESSLDTRQAAENGKNNEESTQPEVNDIEDMITNYQIKQPPLADRLNPEPLEDLIPAILENQIQRADIQSQTDIPASTQTENVFEVPILPEDTSKTLEPSTQEVSPGKIDVSQLASHLANKLDNQLAQIMSAAPVFIEVAVEQNTRPESPQDCLMLLESVQCEVDPSSLMLPEHGPDTDSDMEIVETDNKISEDPNPISLLTSSDEDEVIIEEPHIDTVEVSDETDEDDRPLQRFIKEKPKQKKPEKKKKKGNFEYFVHSSPYYCVQCDYRTDNEAEFLQHNLELAHLHGTTIQVCSTCNYSTASKAQFSRHKRKHKDERNFKCHLCNYKARHNMSLIYHLRCHDPVEKKQEKFTCEKCGFSSNAKSEALNHLKSCGGKERNTKYSCEQCSYSTKRRSDLRRHRLRRHSVDDSDEDFTI